jgi:phage shock protein A
MSFTQKLRGFILGTANDLLDRAIDMNSPSMLRQYTRDLEQGLDSLRNEAAIQAGQIRTLTREIGDLQNTIAVDSAMVTKILERGDVSLNIIARTKAAAIVENKKSLTAKQETLEAQKKTSAAIDDAVSKLDAKHTLMVQQVRELERIDRDSKAKEQAAASLEQAGKLVGNGSGISIDDIKGKMTARNDVASEKFDRAMGSIKTDDEAIGADTSEVDDLLRSLQPKQ